MSTVLTIFSIGILGICLLAIVLALYTFYRITYILDGFLLNRMIQTLSTIVSEIWSTYYIQEIIPLISTNSLLTADFNQLRQKFIKEVIQVMSPDCRKILFKYFSYEGCCLLIGKDFDKKVVPLFMKSTKEKEGS